MRNSYLVCYDITDDKRLHKVFQTMRDWGDHLQYSIFECPPTPSDGALRRLQVSEIIKHRDDQVLFVDLVAAKRRARSFIRTRREYRKAGAATRPLPSPLDLRAPGSRSALPRLELPLRSRVVRAHAPMMATHTPPANVESATLELERSMGELRETIQALCAFAADTCGQLVIGVKPNRGEHGGSEVLRIGPHP